MSSNQHNAVLGMGTDKTTDDVTVDWPSEVSESFGAIGTGVDCLLVEGSGEAFLLGEHR